MKINFPVLASLLFSFSVFAGSATPPATYPATPTRAVVDEYHGTKVTDPYRWLEDSANAEVKAWTEAQDAFARKYLDQLPALEGIRGTLKAWNDFKSPIYRTLTFRNGKYFALKLAPPKNQSLLVVLQSPDHLKTEKVVLDPNALDSKGTTAIDFFAPSRDGSRVAVSLSKGGSESGTLFVYETATGKALKDEIPGVNKPTAGGSVAWNMDGTGFFYTRYPQAGERPTEDLDFFQQVYFHKIGTSAKDDVYSLGRDFPRIAEIHLASSEDGKTLLATVANGDGGEYFHFIRNSAGVWTQLTKFSDRITSAVLGLNGDLYFKSLAGSPRGKILRLFLSEPELAKAKVVVPEGSGVVEEMVPTQNKLYVSYLVGGPTEVRAFGLGGEGPSKVPVQAVSDVSNLIRIGGDQLIYRSQSYTEPVSWSIWDGGKVKKTALITRTAVDYRGIEVRQEFARSKDGTEVPMTLLYRKGLNKDGKNPTLLYAYGGYGVSLTPHYMQDLKIWLDHGGVYAVANIRGGGEFGDDWHLAGNLTKKQNVFDDFIASAEKLIQAKYTDRTRLAIEGGSNGGLLMGAVLAQRPELFRAVVSHVGIYDMLRVETDPNGTFNVTEFGTVKDPEQFKALYAYSPVHRITDKTAYPATLLLTGANDGRVNPYHSKKMVARLQAANGSGEPALLRVTFDGGHGIGRSISQKVAQEADVYAFLFDKLGITFKKPEPKGPGPLTAK